MGKEKTESSRTNRTDRARERFIAALRESGNVSAGVRAAGYARSTIYLWKDENAEFAAQWEEALEEAIDSLEQEAWRRGVLGIEKPITHQGKITATTKEYSDRMLEILLKAHRPEKYRERIEHKGAFAHEHNHVHRIGEAIDARIAEMVGVDGTAAE